MPSRQEIIDYIAQSDGTAVRRDIARAFNIKGEARAELRDLLKTMEQDGALERAGKSRFVKADALPPVAPVDVISVDEDGDLLCSLVNWRGDGDPPIIRLSERKAAKQKPPPGIGDRLLVRLNQEGGNFYDASVIKSIGKGAHRFLAVYRQKKNGGIAEPVERRARNTFTVEKQDSNGAKDGDLVWIEAKNARGYGPKKARVRAVEGHVDDKSAFSLIALASHGIPLTFADDVLEEADKATLPTLSDRTDLRDIPLLTIDPADAKDHDDAVWAAPDDAPENPGGFKVIVAIADVSFFVRPGSKLDREALRRGNSTYLPDRVVPMLPERLSTDLCSLRENEDRPCLAVEMILTSQGVKKSHRFMRAMMRSAGKLAYEDAQAIIDGTDANPVHTQTVRCVHAAYRARLEERRKRAPLELELPERRIVLNKHGTVKEIVRKERFDAHKLIEEFMILANVAAAETLERRKMRQIYRVHDTPDPERLDGVRDHLDTLGYTLIKGPSVRPTHFNQILKIAEKREQKEMVSDIILRAQRQAVYATDNLGHFGLNLARYSHFTSPIRRYADLTVHRALVSACKLGSGGQTDEEASSLYQVAQQISDLERRSIAAEREATDRYLSSFLSDRIGAEFDGRIRGVTRYGLFVMLDETGADGFIPMRTLGFERFRFEEDRQLLIGETTKLVYRLGQAVRVLLAEATPLTGGLRFEMLSDPEADPSRKKSSAKKTSKKLRRIPKKKTTRTTPKGKKTKTKNRGAKR